jgi:hypothetical protein
MSNTTAHTMTMHKSMTIVVNPVASVYYNYCLIENCMYQHKITIFQYLNILNQSTARELQPYSRIHFVYKHDDHDSDGLG